MKPFLWGVAVGFLVAAALDITFLGWADFKGLDMGTPL